MKRYLFLAILVLSSCAAFISCNDEETYADQKERENKQIKKWLITHDIKDIKMSQFLKDTVTDLSRNEYVLFADNGVYMQIVSRGDGRMIEQGETWNLNARFVEVYVGSGDTICMNLYQQDPDKFYVQRTGGNYTASFKSGIMANKYGTSVPSAWIMAFPYIKPGMGAAAAKVRLIVPHNQGTQAAASSVYPTFYELTISAKLQ